jgi:MYXO-CTERM domain-containing protein
MDAAIFFRTEEPTPMRRIKAFQGLVAVTFLVGILSSPRAVGAPDAGTKTLIDYFLPTPIVCPLTSNTWGAAGVLPRDTCNGLEDSTNKQWQYWDGKILKGADGKYHMYAGEWPQNKGFADWPQSVIVEAVSNGTVVGSYLPSTTTPFTGKEQNVTGAVLSDGSYLLLDSLGNGGTGNIYTSTSLADPWTAKGQFQISGGSTSTQTTENLTIWANADGSFEIMSRSFQEMVSTSSILGPYTIKATVPSLQSQGYEDPVIWCSGGQYHLVANGYNARKANHYTSVDGINNWKNMGLAYDPTSDFVRYTDGTVNHWYKMERAGVVMENGHVTAFTFAVIDVDKTLDVANDTHGSKIIVVPFDGVAFDRDNPGPGSAACPVDSGGSPDAGQPGTGGAAGTGGRSGSGGAVATGGAAGTGGRSGSGGTIAVGGTGGSGAIGAGGASGSGGKTGTSGTGGVASTGGAAIEAGGSVAAGAGGKVGVGGSVATGGSTETGGSTIIPNGLGGSASTGGISGVGAGGGATTVTGSASASSGCSCRLASSHSKTANLPGFGVLGLVAIAALGLRLRRRPSPNCKGR